MKIIAIDSSGLTASVAVIEDDNLIAEYNVQYKKTHSQTLLPMLDEIKGMIDLDLATVDAIAIAKGPGSFTGLRIGSATAKGLAGALDIPIVEISTLEGLACNLYGTDALVVPMMDARRSQVYTAVYEFIQQDDKYILSSVMEDSAMAVEDLLVKVNELGASLKKKIIFLGDGVPVYEDKIRELTDAVYTFAPAHMNRQRAAAFGYLAIDKVNSGDVVSAFDHAPEYLRLSQAERERNEGIKNKGSNY
ncbi:MAG: tRNA (adenosine(37)-N6)-threonylcarbamoyltransferase complex dimerization subunit type 1 TsaB [Lachnospiraceae bacterium]|nr:tRNA (adenosine(37)-N6)-threonylcarbamoyltransferase complex dimerization subunit type 1 TsaB [Lachnospiraceae bacterium]